MNNVVKNSKTSPKKSVTAKQQAKSNLTKRKNPDWDNLDRGYRYLTQDMKLPHDQAVAVMGNVVEESQGDYKSVQKNGGGRGLIQWDGRKAPNGRYSQWGSIWASVAKPANVYDSTTDTVKNYWAPWGGLKGDKVRQKFIKAPLKEKARIYAESYLRPGKPRITDRQLSTMQLDSIYNPKIKDIIVQKNGGMLDFLKNGSGIHIKEKNKGKFTSYCGGKVTDECIQKGKNSSNPAIRKRATFAANARKWKHKDGGVLYIFQEGGKTSWWNKAINFMNNSGLGEVALNALSTYTQNKQIGTSSDVAKAQVDKDKASRIQQANLAAEQEANDIQQNNVNPENPNAMSGDIVKNFIKNKLLSQKMALINQESNQEKAEIDWQTQQLKNQNTTNMWAGIGSTLMQGLGHVGQYMGNKQQTNVSNT